MIDEREMKYILQVAEDRNFSHAAKKLYVAQPSLSQCIKKVEQELGVELFDRRTNPLSLTYAGKLYIEKVKQIQQVKTEFTRQIEDISHLKCGHLSIGSSHSRTAYLLTRILPRFQSEFPGIELNLVEGTTEELQVYALNGVTDFSFVYLPLPHDELTYERIVDEQILVALPDAHPMSRAARHLPQKPPFPPVDFAALAKESFIVMKQKRKMREIFYQLCAESRMEPKIILQSHSLISAQAIVAGGVGATLVTDTLALHYKLERNPIYFSLKSPVPPRQMVVAYRKDMAKSKAAEAFIAMTKAIIGGKIPK